MPSIKKELKLWFDFPDDPMNGKVLVRHLKSGTVSKILQDSTDTRLIYDKNKGQAETVIKRKDQIESLVVASIAGWENFNGEPKEDGTAGEPLECTEENIIAFCIEDGFSEFIADCREKLSELSKKDEEDAEKN